ncbi:MAG: cupin domain-containing protein [Proteobacteria bacterium]|nr:cupin domain-containing protein [Pseudomonadota bacterium]
MNGESFILRFNDLPSVDRGGGVKTTPLIKKFPVVEGITTGITTFPPGNMVPLHAHNCAEQVTVLAGEAEAEIDGERFRLKAPDTTFIAAGKPHRFINVGSTEMTILWIYGAREVTRTFVESGETVGHLSEKDVGGSR